MSMSASSDRDSLNGGLPTIPAVGGQADAARPSIRRQVFASVLTPNWSLGLLLLACLTLPAYRGCGGEVVYVGAVFQEVEPTAESVYMTFLITWPFLFGLLVAGGTLWIACGGDTRRARVLWWLLAGLVVVYLLLLTAAIVMTLVYHDSPERFGQELLDSWPLTVPAIGALALVVFTARCCRNHFTAAMWLQCGLAVLAAVSVSVATPGFLLAQEFLFGGMLAVAASVLLVLSTTVCLLDGQRALERRADESPLQLSLKSMLLLMFLGGVACCWVGTFLLAEIPTE